MLDITTLVYSTPIRIEKDRIKEQTDKYIVYQSTNLTNVLVKRYGENISMAGIVSDNSSIPVGSRLLTEIFTLKDKKVKVRYRKRKTFIHLLSLEVIYPNKTRVYIDLTSLPQSDFRVYNTTEYGSEFKNIQVFFAPNETAKINLIKIPKYELYPESYIEWLKDNPNRGITKYKYAIRCYDENANQITPTQTGNDIEIKPTTYLLWYNKQSLI